MLELQVFKWIGLSVCMNINFNHLPIPIKTSQMKCAMLSVLNISTGIYLQISMVVTAHRTNM